MLTVGSDATLNEPEDISAYFEPFGSALVPVAPGARDSIASCESDSLLTEKKDSESEVSCFSLHYSPNPKSFSKFIS